MHSLALAALLRYWEDGSIGMAEVCSICEGSGLRVVEREGRRFAEACICQIRERADKRLRRAAIPRRYEHCAFESYETALSYSHRSQGAALLRARKASSKRVRLRVKSTSRSIAAARATAG